MTDYWIVVVSDPGTHGPTRRFRFPVDPVDPRAASAEAWSCYAKATRAGFTAQTEYVSSHRSKTPVAVRQAALAGRSEP